MSLAQPSHSSALRIAAYSLIAAGLLCRWSVLHTGFTVDDYAQLSMMEGTFPVPRGPLSLFTFSDGGTDENARLREIGFFPWWSDPELRVSLMRPLSSALMWFDLRTFGKDAFAFHLHSAAWWIAMMIAIWEFFRRVASGWASVIALAVIVVHPAHTMLLGWLANRNALVATTLAVLGLLAQLRAQERRSRADYYLAAALYAAGLLASEYAMPTLAFGAFLALIGPSAPASRGRTLAQWIAGGLAYLGLRSSLGFGTRGSGMYIDPVREPLAFLEAAMVRLPVLMGEVVFAVRSSWWSDGFPWAHRLVGWGVLQPQQALDLRSLHYVQIGIGVFACLVYVVVALRVSRRSAASADRFDQRFLVWAIPFTLLPCAASMPESRLLLPGLLGWSAVLAQQVQSWRGLHGARAALGRAATVGLVTLVLIAPLGTGAAELRGFAQLAHVVRQSILDRALDPHMGPHRHVFLASAVDPTTTIYIPWVRRVHSRPAPESCQLLMSGWGPLRLTRVSSSAFGLEHLSASFTGLDVYAGAFNRKPLQRGERFRTGDLEVTVERVHDGRAMKVLYELHRPLEADVTLLIQTDLGLRPVAFPPVRSAIVLPPAMAPLRFGSGRR